MAHWPSLEGPPASFPISAALLTSAFQRLLPASTYIRCFTCLQLMHCKEAPQDVYDRLEDMLDNSAGRRCHVNVFLVSNRAVSSLNLDPTRCLTQSRVLTIYALSCLQPLDTRDCTKHSRRGKCCAITPRHLVCVKRIGDDGAILILCQAVAAAAESSSWDLYTPRRDSRAPWPDVSLGTHPPTLFRPGRRVPHPRAPDSQPPASQLPECIAITRLFERFLLTRPSAWPPPGDLGPGSQSARTE